MDNVFTKGTTYLYFNKQTFKWYCSETLGIYECDADEDILHYYVSTQDDGWQDLNIGETGYWQHKTLLLGVLGHQIFCLSGLKLCQNKENA